MILIAHLTARASRPLPALPGASPALPARPDAGPPPSDRRPRLPFTTAPTSRVPLRRKRPAGTRGSGDIDEPSAVTERARSIGDHAASEIDAPSPRLTPTCGGHLRRPRTEEWPLPDHHPRSRHQLGALDPRSPITEEVTTLGTHPKVHNRLPKTAECLGFSGPIIRQRDCRPKASWRSGAHCHLTFFSPAFALAVGQDISSTQAFRSRVR